MRPDHRLPALRTTSARFIDPAGNFWELAGKNDLRLYQ